MSNPTGDALKAVGWEGGQVSDSMVERVAAAIAKFEADGGQPFTTDQRDTDRALARAAIAAMREPTADQLEACGNHGVGRIVWRQMIDAALG